MVYQWYLFVLLFAVAVFVDMTRQTYTVNVNGYREKRYGWIPVLMIAIPLIYLAGTRPNIGDTGAYRASFLALNPSWDSLADIIAADSKDKGFSALVLLLKMIIGNNDKLYFTIIATICLTCVIYTYKKYSCNFLMSMFLFIASSDYIQWNYNGMRQFIAVSIAFAATDWLLEKKYVKYFLLILFLSTIHASVLVMIPIALIVQGKAWNFKTVLLTMGSLIVINYSDAAVGLITDFMAETQYSGEVGQFLETEGTNVLRVLVFCIPPLMAFAFRKWIDRADSKLLNISTNMAISSMGAYIVSSVTSGIFVGRIPIYFSLYNYILLPWLIENVFDEKLRRVVYVVLIACYLIFYYYQMNVAWDFSAFM